MKIICMIISFIFLAGFVFLVYLTKNNTLISGINGFPDLDAVLYSLLIGFCAFLMGFFFNLGKVEDLKSVMSKQLRKAEKAGIDTQESLDKIDRLNSKIETLEIALKDALNRNKNT